MKDEDRVLKALIKAGANPDQGRTLLHYAALHDQSNMIFLPSESGADVNAADNEGKTPLDCFPPKSKVSDDDSKDYETVPRLLREKGAGSGKTNPSPKEKTGNN